MHLQKKESNDQYRLKSGADSVCSELRTFHAGLVLYKSTQSGHAPSVGDPVFGKTPWSIVAQLDTLSVRFLYRYDPTQSGPTRPILLEKTKMKEEKQKFVQMIIIRID